MGMMDDTERQMHLRAGEFYGKDATCGPPGKSKINYAGEDSAARAAIRQSEEYQRDLEAYPCFWCGGWHIGREMTQEEREQFS